MNFEGLRTRGARLAEAASRLKSLSAWPDAGISLAYLTTAERGPSPDVIARACGTLVTIVYRHHGDPRRRSKARALAAACRRSGARLLIAGDLDLVRDAGADGLHWSWRGGAPPDRRHLDDLMLTCSCHDLADLAAARASGADAAFLSPAFKTRSHPGAAALGVDGFRHLASEAGLPVLALGGVNEMNAPHLAGPNVVGFGAIDAFAAKTMSGPQPEVQGNLEGS
ncbi:MAG: thiamine phosphate synthase [Alphaproteobacteria bacterium]|nr:thiamine phosphate synthase [Alphaproteobacteria bacterium]